MSAEAEVVELLHHLALVDVLIQAAVGVGPFVLGILLGQCGEALLGLVPGLELGQDLLGTGLRGFLRLVRVVAFFIRFRLDQDVADTGGEIVVVLAAEVHHHRVTGGILFRIREDLNVTGLALGLHPLCIGRIQAAAADAGALRGLCLGLGLHGSREALRRACRRCGGFGSLGVLRRLGIFCGLRIPAVLVSHHDGVGGRLRLGAALLVGNHLDGVFRTVFTGDRVLHGLGGHEVKVKVKQVAVAVQALVVLFQFLVGIGERAQLLVVRLLGKRHVQRRLADDLHCHAAAVVHGVELVGTAVAVAFGGLFHAGKLLVDLRDFLIGQADAVFSGILQQRTVLLHIPLREIPEVIAPGSALGHAAFLIIESGQAHAGVQAEVGEVLAVGVDHVQIFIAVEVVDFCRGIFLAVGGQRRRRGIHQAGVEKQDRRDQHDDADRSPCPLSSRNCLLFRLFLGGDGLLVGAGLAGSDPVLSFG